MKFISSNITLRLEWIADCAIAHINAGVVIRQPYSMHPTDFLKVYDEILGSRSITLVSLLREKPTLP